MQANTLMVNFKKTKFILFGNKCQSYSINISCSQQTVSQVDYVWYLGILTDFELTWTSHLENSEKKSLIEPAFYLNSNLSPMCVC